MIETFLPAIERLPVERPLTKKDLLTESFTMEKEGELEMYFAPHNEYLNREAKIIIAGITPGWNQMKTAYEHFTTCLAGDNPLGICLKKAKIAARFAGSMKANLIHMLDQCGIPQILGIRQSADLFNESTSLLHTTSMIKYPVFLNGRNYSGYQPSISRSLLLHHYAYEIFPEELARIAPPALIIPLGKIVEQVVHALGEEKKLAGHRYVTGFPHPSGANGHRLKQFKQQEAQLREAVVKWAQVAFKKD